MQLILNYQITFLCSGCDLTGSGTELACAVPPRSAAAKRRSDRHCTSTAPSPGGLTWRWERAASVWTLPARCWRLRPRWSSRWRICWPGDCFAGPWGLCCGCGCCCGCWRSLNGLRFFVFCIACWARMVTSCGHWVGLPLLVRTVRIGSRLLVMMLILLVRSLLRNWHWIRLVCAMNASLTLIL